jgi:hypothetical protein
MILSDASICFSNNSKDARLQIEQKDRSFVDHLWDLLNSVGLVGARPKERITIIKPSGNTRFSYCFKTFTLPFFT